MTHSSRLRYLWLTLAAVFLDRASKAWIESSRAAREAKVVCAHGGLVRSARP